MACLFKTRNKVNKSPPGTHRHHITNYLTPFYTTANSLYGLAYVQPVTQIYKRSLLVRKTATLAVFNSQTRTISRVLF